MEAAAYKSPHALVPHRRSIIRSTGYDVAHAASRVCHVANSSRYQVQVTVKDRLSRARTVVDSNIKPGDTMVLLGDRRLHLVEKVKHGVPFRAV